LTGVQQPRLRGDREGESNVILGRKEKPSTQSGLLGASSSRIRGAGKSSLNSEQRKEKKRTDQHMSGGEGLNKEKKVSRSRNGEGRKKT